MSRFLVPLALATACATTGTPFGPVAGSAVSPTPSRAQNANSVAAWHNSDAKRSFPTDSLECASTASQLAGSRYGETYRSEFGKCVSDKGWREARRYAGRDSCAPVAVSWVNPPPEPPAGALDSLRQELESAITANFFPRDDLRDLEARVAFDVSVIGGRAITGMPRVVSSSGGSNWTGSASQRDIVAEMTVSSADLKTGIVEYQTLNAVAALHARCLRDFAVRERRERD